MKIIDQLLNLFPNLDLKYISQKLNLFRKWLDDIDEFDNRYTDLKHHHCITINGITNFNLNKKENEHLQDILLSLYRIYYYLENIRYDISIFDEWADISKTGLLQNVSRQFKYFGPNFNNYLYVLYKSCFIDTIRILHDTTEFGKLSKDYKIEKNNVKIDIWLLSDLNFYVIFKKMELYIKNNGISCRYDPDAHHFFDDIYQQNEQYTKEQIKKIFSDEQFDSFEIELLKLKNLEKMNFEIDKIIKQEKIDIFFLKFLKHNCKLRKDDISSNFKLEQLAWLFCMMIIFYKYMIRCFCPFWLFDFTHLSNKLNGEKIFGHIYNSQYKSPSDIALNKNESVFLKDFFTELKDKLS